MNSVMPPSGQSPPQMCPGPPRSAQEFMTDTSNLLIGELPGFTPHIGRLVSMLNYVRSTTVAAVDGLSQGALDHVPDAHGNSIGALLAHIAAAEAGYQASTFESRELNEREKRQWGAALELGERARHEIKGHELGYHLGLLEEVRVQTLAELARRDDRWLEEETSFAGGRRVNNYFKWFHVVTHEVNHRGQIRWLRRRAATTA